MPSVTRTCSSRAKSLRTSSTEFLHRGRLPEPDLRLFSNPPFGVSWKKVKDQVVREHEEEGFAGRFGAGTPRTNDGAFLFLQHMLSKMKSPTEGGSRIAIVFNGSPLFNGGPNSQYFTKPLS